MAEAAGLDEAGEPCDGDADALGDRVGDGKPGVAVAVGTPGAQTPAVA